jgi:hypothetical protein
MVAMVVCLGLVTAACDNTFPHYGIVQELSCPGCKIAVVNTLPADTELSISAVGASGECMGGIPYCFQSGDGCFGTVILTLTPPLGTHWYRPIGEGSWLGLTAHEASLCTVEVDLACGGTIELKLYEGASLDHPVGSMFVCCTGCNHTSVDPPAE